MPPRSRSDIRTPEQQKSRDGDPRSRDSRNTQVCFSIRSCNHAGHPTPQPLKTTMPSKEGNGDYLASRAGQWPPPSEQRRNATRDRATNRASWHRKWRSDGANPACSKSPCRRREGWRPSGGQQWGGARRSPSRRCNWVQHPSSLGLPAESTTDRGVGMPRKRALHALNCHTGRGKEGVMPELRLDPPYPQTG